MANRPTVIRIKTIMKKEDYDNLEKRIKQQNSNVIVIPHNTELVTPADRPQGEWKHLGGDEWLCSNCGHVVWTEGSWEHPLERGKDYCEHCGARMKGIDES